MRKSDIFLIGLFLGAVFFGLLMVDAGFRQRANRPLIESRAALVKTLQLTDLCLFTEARYARHLSQADLHTAFQDYPMSMEHFPAGSFTQPPAGIRTMHEEVDRKATKHN